jgi:hypothetical protein
LQRFYIPEKIGQKCLNFDFEIYCSRFRHIRMTTDGSEAFIQCANNSKLWWFSVQGTLNAASGKKRWIFLKSHSSE